MYIDKNQKRFNPHAEVIYQGVPYHGNVLMFPEVVAALGLQEIPDSSPPEDYSESLYYRTEQDEAPYIVYTRKPDEIIYADRWEKIKVLRDTLQQEGGCQVDDFWYHTDTDSKSKWEHMVNNAFRKSLADEDPYLISGVQVSWKTMSGVYVPLTAGLIRRVVAALELREAMIFNHGEYLRTTLTADLNSGWPAHYEE